MHHPVMVVSKGSTRHCKSSSQNHWAVDKKKHEYIDIENAHIITNLSPDAWCPTGWLQIPCQANKKKLQEDAGGIGGTPIVALIVLHLSMDIPFQKMSTK